MKISSTVKHWLPPVFIQFINNNFGDGAKFSDQLTSWDFANSNCSGYGSSDILAHVLNATLKVKLGQASYERDSNIFSKIDYDWPALSGFLWAAARNRGNLNVLDFGGALGSSYFQHRDFLKNLFDVRWNVVEQPHFVEAGKTHIQDDILRFYSSIPECLSHNRPNVIFLSSVLQYLPKPFDILDSLMCSNADVLIIDKTIVNDTEFDRVYIQRVPKKIYKASYPCWSLSESKLMNAISGRYLLTAELASLSFPELSLISSDFKGYIFRRATL